MPNAWDRWPKASNSTLPVCNHLQYSVNEFLTYTVHCECSDPGPSIIQDDPLCQSVSNDAGHSSTSLKTLYDAHVSNVIAK